MRCFRDSLRAFVLLIMFNPVLADTVKKTSSGICHPPASPYYERTQDFRAFDSGKACLTSGGRLPRGLAGKYSTRSPPSGPDSYERSAYGHGWEDVDGDCQNSRAEALIATSSTTVRFASDKGCAL